MDNQMKIAIEKFMMMTETISSSGKNSCNYNTDVEIYRSEIHIIQLIGDYDDLHVSEIARKLGVTKGAVSQILKKLVRKGLVEKYVDESNNTRLLVKLTKKGKLAYNSHEKYHNECDKDMFSYLDQLSSHELEVVITFMEKASEMARRHI